MKKIFIIILVIICIISLLLFLLNWYNKNNIMDGDGMINPGLTYFSYTDGGDMSGYFYDFTLNGDTIVVREQMYNGVEETTKTYELTDEIYNEFSKLVKSYDYTIWPKLKLSEYQALDAGTVSIHITFDNGKSYRISDNYEMPNDQKDLFKKAKELINKVTK